MLEESVMDLVAPVAEADVADADAVIGSKHARVAEGGQKARSGEGTASGFSHGVLLSVIFLQCGAQTIVRKRKDSVPVDSGYGFRPDHRIDDGFFGRLDDGFEYGGGLIVIQHRDTCRPLGSSGSRIGRGKCDEEIAGPVTGRGPGSREAHGGAPRETLRLVRQQGRVGSYYDDDGPRILAKRLPRAGDG